ncbi:MAG: DUF4446 family protein [Actinobacteria bacterium]|nr:DUF4446 family protein [Actinomycetota bacterium]
MILPEATMGVLVLATAAVVVLLLGVVVVLAVRLARLRSAYASALDPARREDLFQAVQRQAEDLDGLRRDVGIVHDNTEQLRSLLREAVSRVGIVRYDAFADMGGALSFSAALLDEDGHGVVLSAINGRSETRAYAKPLVAGASQYNLSQEELAAIEAAMAGSKGQQGGAAPAGRRGRRRDAS